MAKDLSKTGSSGVGVTTTSVDRLEARLGVFLTAVMGILSVFVFGLGLDRGNVLWMWLGFICVLVSGIFVQLLIERKKVRDAAERSGKCDEHLSSNCPFEAAAADLTQSRRHISSILVTTIGERDRGRVKRTRN
jgi:hypothetical protein